MPRTRNTIAFNMLNLLTDAQVAELVALAGSQIERIKAHGYRRFPLMKAFRRLLEGALPSGSAFPGHLKGDRRLSGAIGGAQPAPHGDAMSDHTTVVDATCPKVATIQQEIAEFSRRGYAVVIAGYAAHPEVVGLLGLAEIAEGLGTRALHIETAAELPLAELATLKRVGVTAGASTPAWIIGEVLTALRAL